MKIPSNYDKRPSVTISQADADCALGWSEILTVLRAHSGARKIAIECYPGVLIQPLRNQLVAGLAPQLVLESCAAMLAPQEVESKFAAFLGDDPVFGLMTPQALEEFFDPAKVAHSRQIADQTSGG